MNYFSKSRIKPKKTNIRLKIIEGIAKSLKSDKIFNVINYKNWMENEIQAYMHGVLIGGMENLFKEIHPKQLEKTIERKAVKALLWEGDVNTTISNIHFFGVQHRPDFVVQTHGIKIAVEVKRGDTGGAIREGIGQSLVYSMDYDFVFYLIIDISNDKKVKHSITGNREIYLTESLWNNFNIRLDVV